MTPSPLRVATVEAAPDPPAAVAAMLDSLARLFVARARKARRERTDSDADAAYIEGLAVAYQDAANECREGAAHMRKSP